MEVHHHMAEPWKVTLVDTGENTMTGGRLKRIAAYLNDEDFCFTYGDGISDVDISKQLEFHRQQSSLATVMAVQPPGRFGSLDVRGNKISAFDEKPIGDGAWINGGYFVLSPKVLDYIRDDTTVWESGPLRKLAEEGELSAFCHNGFWQPMDTLRDKVHLEELWGSGNALWKVWD